ncbi:DeoR/GlpR family DNA-binding transcription regulator [Oceanobacillus sp. Castelsardo]|uniref:DeoR/GlpR family DNA-binding transcription regulator n=1 Tax=Oceanobacillus sp. Castelsardo TaxID=1851204 RepID=UPI000838A74B|nr:DeoR/GlpR family DNA-binding transcription regulator [Oceanobacillus sp. Castelsardo]
MKMFVSERRNIIMKVLKENKRITVKELAKEINVSEATLRTDLNKLEQNGLLARTHGGAVLNDELGKETNFSVRKLKNKEEKKKISLKALEMVQDKQCILLDASSTALELASFIKKQPKQLTVITSGIQTAMELKENPDITVILIGGVVTKGSAATEGTLGLNILDYVYIDTMFTSPNGFTFESGLTDFNLYEVSLKKEMIKRANNVITLIDSSKIGTNSSAVFAETDKIDTLITDKAVDKELVEKLQQSGVNVVIAN